MTKFLLTLLSLSMLAASALCGPIGTTAPAFTLKDVNGLEVRSDRFNGKVVLIDFWAPWCSPCRQEMKELEALYRKQHDAGLEVVAISVDPSAMMVRQYLRKVPLSYTVLLDSAGTAAKEFGCSHLPTGYLIGRDGVIRAVHKGFGSESREVFEKEIVELLRMQ